MIKLQFLGQSYYRNNPAIETEISDQIARFRGSSYSIRRPVKVSKSELGFKKYRGVFYNS